jgi:hypothetical protein
MKPTIVCIGTRDINGTRVEHGEELPPDLLPQETIDKMLDQKILAEICERRSLYRLFASFSGSQEREPLDAELTQFTLTKV